MTLNPEAHVLDIAGAFLFHNSQPQQALAVFRDATRKNPSDWHILQHYVQALNSFRRFSEAFAELEQFIVRQPRHVEALRQLANVLGEVGQHDEVRHRSSESRT